jgi:hypothetical protein
MFRCERCGSSFSPIRVPHTEACPRCRARDRVWAPLSFAPFSAITSEADDALPPGEELRPSEVEPTE